MVKQRPARRFVTRGIHHPWREMGKHTEWTVKFVPQEAMPDGRVGWTRFDLLEVWIVDDLTQAERRCTIAHETQHVRRGPFAAARRVHEEAWIDRRVARLLVPSVRLAGHALAWAHACGEDWAAAAEELWVDEQTLHARLSTLTPLQRTRLDEQLATVLL